MIGQTINNYLLERKLGEGGMGDVYFARHNRIDRVVAIKVLHKNLFTNESIRVRFKNEANALIKLGHPNIVKIYDYVEQDEFACLIMEYIEGYTLDDYITKVTGPLPGPKATSIIVSVLEAVQYAHDNNVFHRDIKPGNIMVSKDGRMVRIMDFSIAKFTDAANLKITHANAQIGTPFYMSPEQVKGIAYTAQSDIYSIGVTLFEMVTGKCPYLEITNLFELQSKIVNEPLPPTSKYYPNVTGRLQDAIVLATNKLPEQRFKSCHEFRDYLLEGEKVVPVVIPVPVPLSKPIVPPSRTEKSRPEPAYQPVFIEEKKKSNKWVYVLLPLLIVLLVVVIYSFLNKPTVPPSRPPGDTIMAKTDTHTIKILHQTVLKPLRDIPREADSLISEKEKAMSITLIAPVRNELKGKLIDAITNNPSLINSILVAAFTKKTDIYYPPPTSQRVFNDLVNEKNEARKCGLFSWQDKYLDMASSVSPDGKQWEAKINLKIKDGAKYEVRVTYDKTEKGYFYRNIAGCKILEEDVQVENGGGTTPLPGHDKPATPGKEKVIADFKMFLKNRNYITYGINYSEIDKLSINNVEDGIEGLTGISISYKVHLINNDIPVKFQVTYEQNTNNNNKYEFKEGKVKKL